MNECVRSLCVVNDPMSHLSSLYLQTQSNYSPFLCGHFNRQKNSRIKPVRAQPKLQKNKMTMQLPLGASYYCQDQR